MTTRLQAALTILIALLITLSFSPQAGAQDLDATADKLKIEDLKGVKAAVSRSYAMDIGDIVDAASMDTPQPVVPDGPILMLALVAQFDTAEHASDATTTLHDRLIKQGSSNSTNIQLEATETSNLGDIAWALSGTRASGTSTISINGLLVQKNEWIYLAITVSDNDSGSDAALALVQFSLENRPSTDDIIYDHTGRSRGGIWAKLPAAGDTITLRQGNTSTDALSGTQPVYDAQLLPPPPPED